jgi:hypothetical protein
MALWELDEFQGPQFLGFVRSVPVPQEFAGQNVLPNQTVFDLEVEHVRGAINRPVMASVITWDAEAPIGGRPGLGERVLQELPPIKRKERISEKEILRFLTPRANTPDKQTAINEVFNTTRRLLDSVQARIEWLRWQAISEDTLSYNEDGVIVEFDYGFNPDLQFDVGVDAPLSAYWDDVANANPIADLQHIQQTYNDATGSLLTELWVSRKTIGYLLRNDDARDLIRGSGAPTAQLAPSEVNTLFDLYELPNLRTYDTLVWREELDGSKTQLRPLDYHKGVGLPAFQVGSTIIGPTAESQSLFGTPLQSEAPGVWATVYAQNDPPTQWVKAAATAFPTIPNAEFVVQVELLSSSV